jgi:hypothetical protein
MLDYINNYFAVFTLGFECDRVLWPVAFFVPHPDARGGSRRQLNPMSTTHWSQSFLLPPLPWIARHPRIFLRCDLGWSIRGQDHHVGRCP